MKTCFSAAVIGLVVGGPLVVFGRDPFSSRGFPDEWRVDVTVVMPPAPPTEAELKAAKEAREQWQQQLERERIADLARLQGPAIVQRAKAVVAGDANARFVCWANLQTLPVLADVFGIKRRENYADDLTKKPIALEPQKDYEVRVMEAARRYFFTSILERDPLYLAQKARLRSMETDITTGNIPHWHPVDLPEGVPEDGRKLWEYLQWWYPGVNVASLWDDATDEVTKKLPPDTTKKAIQEAIAKTFSAAAAPQISVVQLVRGGTERPK